MTPDEKREIEELIDCESCEYPPEREFDSDEMAKVVGEVDEVIPITREQEAEMVERETKSMERISGSGISDKSTATYQHYSEELLKTEKLNKTLQDLLEITKTLDARINLLIKRVEKLEQENEVMWDALGDLVLK